MIISFRMPNGGEESREVETGRRFSFTLLASDVRFAARGWREKANVRRRG
jgi:hypothetical protein